MTSPHRPKYGTSSVEISTAYGSITRDRTYPAASALAAAAAPKEGLFLCARTRSDEGKIPRAIVDASATKEEMTKNQFPPGWDEERVRQLLDYYENLSEDEQVAEDEAAL